jgi:hypothetical protein
MRFKYQILFSIQLQLEGDSKIHEEDMIISADTNTYSIYTKQHILEKNQSDVFTILIETYPEGDALDTILMPLDNSQVFTFYLKFKNDQFKTYYSNLSSYDLENNIFVLSNKVLSKNGTVLNLTNPIASYDNTITYPSGYIIKDGTKLFMSLAANTNKPTNNAEFWVEVTNTFYVSQSDLVLRNTLATEVPMNVFGIVQIYTDDTIHADYRLITKSTKMIDGVSAPVQNSNEKKFTINFKNNLTN